MKEKTTVDQLAMSKYGGLHTYSCLFYRFRSQSPGEQEQAWVTIETALQFNDEDIAAMMDLFWSALWKQTDWGKNTAGWSSALTVTFPIVCGEGMWKHDEEFAPFPFMELPDGRCIAKYSEFLRAIRSHCRRKKRPVPDYIDLDLWMGQLSLWYIPESVTIHDFGYVGKEYHIYWSHGKGPLTEQFGKSAEEVPGMNRSRREDQRALVLAKKNIEGLIIDEQTLATPGGSTWIAKATLGTDAVVVVVDIARKKVMTIPNTMVLKNWCQTRIGDT